MWSEEGDGGKWAVRELIELALMQADLCHSTPGKGASQAGLFRCRALQQHQAERTSIQHTHPAIATVNARLPARKHTHTYYRTGARGRHELQDHRSVRARPLPARRDAA